jgi:hypothetical protein
MISESIRNELKSLCLTLVEDTWVSEYDSNYKIPMFRIKHAGGVETLFETCTDRSDIANSTLRNWLNGYKSGYKCAKMQKETDFWYPCQRCNANCGTEERGRCPPYQAYEKFLRDEVK